ncbi:MAG: asparaginyl-tRNA synthetase [Piccolia ochrophora]|nr:MAG: asparaginyl-tRNA synthetase [Piccolia ochrophora]
MATPRNPAPVEEFDYEALPEHFSLGANLVAGAFAGIAEHTVMFPFDSVKTRMQVLNPSKSAMYTGVVNAVSKMASSEGTRSFFRGISSVAVGAGPAHALYFVSYEIVKQAMGGNEGTEHHPFAAVIKQRMQVHGSVYPTIYQCARSVYTKEGFKAFYVSYPTTLSMTIPFTALQFMAYESLSKVFNPSKKYDPMTHCAAGGLAGAFAAGITTPLDVIKTLLQTRGTARDEEIRGAKGLWEAAGIIHRRQGMMGFFRGLKPRVITTMPSTAICWSSYEMAKAYFTRRSESKGL